MQGEAANTVCYLQKGRAKPTVFVRPRQGSWILQEGEFFGEGCLDDGTKLRTTTVLALELCLITNQKEYDAFYPQHGTTFSAFLMAHLVSRNSRIEDDLIDQLVIRFERRLARHLLLLANFGNEQNEKPVAVTVSQETLAEMVGTTRSRVRSFMNKFRKRDSLAMTVTAER